MSSDTTGQPGKRRDSPVSAIGILTHTVDPPQLHVSPHISLEPYDIILRADNGHGYYTRLSLLAELSSFFRDLPKNMKAEDYKGITVIPLEGTDSCALKIFVDAVASLTKANRHEVEHAGIAVLRAASYAKIFDVPVLLRVLIDGLSDYELFAKFAIAAVADFEDDMINFAAQLLSFNILSVSRPIIQFMKQHAYTNWERFKDLILRHQFALINFREQIDGHRLMLYELDLADCSTCRRTFGDQYCERLSEAQDRRAVDETWRKIRWNVCECEVHGELPRIVQTYMEFSEVELRKDLWL